MRLRLKCAGSHSFRKGSVTHLLGIPGGPVSTSIFQRASWSLGNTKGRYIGTVEPGNDQYCGRILAGNNTKSENFDVLPPHFTREGLARINDIGMHKFIDGYDTFPDSYKRCLPMFLAQIVYHLDRLKDMFPSHHFLWGSPVFAVKGSRTYDNQRI